jgi:hypothetical protein
MFLATNWIFYIKFLWFKKKFSHLWKVLNIQNQVNFEFHILAKFRQLKKKAVMYFTKLGSSTAKKKAVKT